MRDIKYVEAGLQRKQDYLEKIDSLPLGFLLKQLHYSCSDIKDFVSNGVFKITFHCHDTGVSTDSYVIKPDKTLYQIARRTYWYNESQYGFNKKWYTHGAWDKKYQEFIEELRTKLKEVTNTAIENLKEERNTIIKNMSEEKSSVEDMFL